MAQKIAVIFHELTHIDSEVGKTVKHDIEDFRIMVDKLGVDWFNDPELPNLLTKKVEFDLNLRPNVPDVEGDLKVDTGDEIIDDVVVEENTDEDEDDIASDTEEEDTDGIF